MYVVNYVYILNVGYHCTRALFLRSAIIGLQHSYNNRSALCGFVASAKGVHAWIIYCKERWLQGRKLRHDAILSKISGQQDTMHCQCRKRPCRSQTLALLAHKAVLNEVLHMQGACMDCKEKLQGESALLRCRKQGYEGISGAYATLKDETFIADCYRCLHGQRVACQRQHRFSYHPCCASSSIWTNMTFD